jgi:hypothetical protein
MRVYRQLSNSDAPVTELNIKPDTTKEVADELGSLLIQKYPFIVDIDDDKYKPSYYERTGTSPDVADVSNSPTFDPIARVDNHDKTLAEIELLKKQTDESDVIVTHNKVFIKKGDSLYQAHSESRDHVFIKKMYGDWYVVSVKDCKSVVEKIISQPSILKRIKKFIYGVL